MLMRTESEIIGNWNSDLPLVSISCITYNHEKYISQCLDGMLAQRTDFPFEIIVHDDASTDDTAQIIKQYEQMYPNIVKPIYETENQYSKGAGNIFRVMNPHLRGKYIAVCEGDDYWCDADKLQRQFDFLESHDDYFAVGHMTRSIDRNGNEIATFIDCKPGEYTLKDLENWQLFAHASSYFSRNYVTLLSGELYDRYLNVRCPGDRKMPLLFLYGGKACVLPEVSSVYRFQSTATSFTSNPENCRWHRLWLEAYDLSKFARILGVDLHFRERKKQFLYTALNEYFKGRKEEYRAIARISHTTILGDLCRCSDIIWFEFKRKYLKKHSPVR